MNTVEEKADENQQQLETVANQVLKKVDNIEELLTMKTAQGLDKVVQTDEFTFFPTIDEKEEKSKDAVIELKEKTPDCIEPDNEQCCQHYSKIISTGQETPYTASIDNPEFDRVMQNRLRYILDKFKIKENGKRDRVLEIMAGCGRNAQLLKQYFWKISMLDAVKENVESCPRYVEGFHMKVQEFNFVEHRYDCILGVWTLCYLNFADRKEVLENIYRSIRP